ncbi:hypothetical protein E2C01_082789 [Portunus trituberculatus]|nr:hypothetical protein [Portunus trituberculatus]
MAFFIW